MCRSKSDGSLVLGHVSAETVFLAACAVQGSNLQINLRVRDNCIAAPKVWDMICAAYDVTRRETFESIEDIWMKEVDMYSTVDDAVKMVVANKVDKVRSLPVSIVSVSCVSLHPLCTVWREGRCDPL